MNTTKKWNWMMNWCKEKNLAPADHKNWTRAERAYNVAHKDVLFCPDCKSDDIFVYEEVCFELNKGAYFCTSIKKGDDCAKVRCNDCEFSGEKIHLLGINQV